MHTTREAFLKSPERAEFEKMATTRTFEAACRAALLTHVEEQVAAREPQDAAAMHYMTVGARQVLAILTTIHLVREEPKPYRGPQLTPPK